MFTEDYVSFETAKLLKEKGFDENTSVNYFVGDDKPRGCVAGEMIYHKRAEEDTHLIACPTLQMTMKWLREVHKLHIILDIHWLYFANQNGWMYTISRILENGNEYIDSKGDENDKNFYPTYEEAAEIAIKYCLENLI